MALPTTALTQPVLFFMATFQENKYCFLGGQYLIYVMILVVVVQCLIIVCFDLMMRSILGKCTMNIGFIQNVVVVAYVVVSITGRYI